MTSRFMLSPFDGDYEEEYYILAQVRYAQFRNCTMEEIQDIPLWRHRNNADSITKAGRGHQLI